MIRHIVMYKFLPEADGRSKSENLVIAQQLADAMSGAIPQLRAFRCAIAAPGSVQTNYDIALICDLDDFDALAQYKLNPAHKAFGTHCHAVCETRASIDYEI